MNQYQLALSGVSCNKCVGRIRGRVEEQDREVVIETSDNKRWARITTHLSLQRLLELIEASGYGAAEQALPIYHGAVAKVSCQGCVKKITNALHELDGDAQVVVDIDEQSIQVTSLLSAEQIESCLESVGKLPARETPIIKSPAPSTEDPAPQPPVTAHQPSPSSQANVVRLNLSGVTCAACVNTIEKALYAQPGMESVSINFGNRTATIQSLFEADMLIKTIEGAGYGASVILDEEQAELEREQAEKNEYRQKIRHTWLGLGLGVPMMAYGLLGGSMMVNTTGEQLAWLLVGLATLGVLCVSGRRYFVGATKALMSRNANMDTLVALGTGTAWLYSMAVVVMPDVLPESARHLYFEASAMIIGLINLGQALELKARGRTSRAIRRLLDLRTKTAVVVREGKHVTVPVEEVVVGDHILIRAGEKVPVDGVVTEGESLIDESMLTGEPIPVQKSAGDSLSAGTINGDRTLHMKATKIGRDTMLAQIIEMVTQAQNSKPSISHLADKVSGVFVPAVMIIAILTALAWYNFGPEPKLIHMLITATSVLIIACPCALGLATPISTMIGIGKSAEFGGLIRNGDALQKASDIDVVILDKTGTITRGKPSVTGLVHVRDNEKTLTYLYALEQGSTHPLASAVRDYCQTQLDDVSACSVTAFQSLIGRGVQASIEGHDLLLGNARLMSDKGIDISAVTEKAQDAERQANTVIHFAVDGALTAMLAISDPIKQESQSAIAAIQALGIRVMMLTGDNTATAKAVAEAVGVDEFHAELMPQDKLVWVEKLQAEGKAVAMVGDGINDAPALAQSDVGFAIGQGTDVAIESADITLMRGSLFGVAQVIEVSKATMKNIRQNLWGAFTYNSLGIPVAAGVLYPLTGALLSPIIAGIAMSLSSITVVSNANRLRLFKPRGGKDVG